MKKEEVDWSKLVNFATEKLGPQPMSNSDKANPHGQKVVDILMQNTQSEIEKTKIDKGMTLSEFIKYWRREFINVMKPKNMPSGWSVDHITLRTFGKKSKFYEEAEDEMKSIDFISNNFS